MKGVAAGAIANKLCIHARPSLLGMFQALQYQDGRSLTHHKAIAVGVKGRLARSGSSLRLETARMLLRAAKVIGCMVVSPPPQIMTSDMPWRMRSAASPMALVLVAQAEDRGHRQPMQQMLDSNLPCRGIGHHHGDHQSAHPLWPAVQQSSKVVYQRSNTADASADDDPRMTVVAILVKGQTRVSDRLVSRDQYQLGESIRPFDLFATQKMPADQSPSPRQQYARPVRKHHSW